MKRKSRNLEAPVLWLIVILVILITAAADILLPLGIAGGTLQIFVPLTSWLFYRKSVTIILSVASTIVIIIGYHLSDSAAVPEAIVLTNRMISITAVWVVCLLVLRAVSGSREKDSLIASLDEQIKDNVAELEEKMEEYQITNTLLEESKAALINVMDDLNESQERFDLVVQGAGAGIWDWLKINGIEQWWSDKFYLLLDYEPGEIPSTLDSFKAILHHDDHERTFQLVEQHFENKVPFLMEYRLKTKSGEYKWFMGTGKAVWDEQGNPERMVGSIIDIHQQKTTEELVVKQRNLLNESQRIANLGSYEWFPQTNEVVWSDQIYEILEIAPEEHDGTVDKIFELIHPDDKEMVMQISQKAIELGKAIPAEYRIITPKGNLKLIKGEGHHELDADGNLLRIYGTLKDITERAEVQNRLELFFNQSLELICVANAEGYFLELNPRWEEVLGFTEDELKSKPFVDFVHPEDVEATILEAQKLAKGHRSISFINRYRTKSGDYKWLEWTAATDSLTGLLLSVARDITEQKQAKDLLEQQKNELESKNQELEQFTYIASHDLQEPLRTMINFAKLLSDRYASELDDSANKFLGFMVGASERMQMLITSLLDYSRIGSKGELELIDVSVLLDGVIADLAATIEERKAKIQVGKMPEIHCHPVEIRLLFQNLISNAIRYSREGVPPEVKITQEREGNYWKFTVSDNGQGIEEKHFDKIFIIFQRLSNETKGSGIGLSHCKKIVEIHHGKIWVESEVGVGSKFIFTIPVNLKTK